MKTKTKPKQHKTCMGCLALRVIFPCCHEYALGTAYCFLGHKIQSPSLDGKNYRALFFVKPLEKCMKNELSIDES